jgi:hypothetical protein
LKKKLKTDDSFSIFKLYAYVGRFDKIIIVLALSENKKEKMPKL